MKQQNRLCFALSAIAVTLCAAASLWSQSTSRAASIIDSMPKVKEIDQATISPDGAQVAFIIGGELSVMPSKGGTVRSIAVDGKLMSSDVQTTPTFHAGIPRALFDPHIARSSGAPFAIRYDVTPDGHRFLINSTGLPEAGASEGITVVLNWTQSSSK